MLWLWLWHKWLLGSMTEIWYGWLCSLIFCGCVTFNLDPPKIGSPWNKFFWNTWTYSEKFVPTIGQPHKDKSVTTKDISGVHNGISKKISDCFHGYASALTLTLTPHSIRNVRSLQTLHNVCRNWVLCAAGNETTVHCVLLTWQALVVSRNLRNHPFIRHWSEFCKWNMFQGLQYSSRNLRNPPTYTTSPNFASEICSRVYNIHPETSETPLHTPLVRILQVKYVPGSTLLISGRCSKGVHILQ